jgi:hypothetical protein
MARLPRRDRRLDNTIDQWSPSLREFASKLAVEARDWEAAVTESGVKID